LIELNTPPAHGEGVEPDAFTGVYCAAVANLEVKLWKAELAASLKSAFDDGLFNSLRLVRSSCPSLVRGSVFVAWVGGAFDDNESIRVAMMRTWKTLVSLERPYWRFEWTIEEDWCRQQEAEVGKVSSYNSLLSSTV
jgi:hypothetical protein